MCSTRSLALRSVMVLMVMLATPVTVSADRVVVGLKPAWLQGALDDYWGSQFAAASVGFRSPQVFFHHGNVVTGCGETPPGASYYCPADNAILVDDSDYESTTSRFGETYWVTEVAVLWGGAAIWQLDLGTSGDRVFMSMYNVPDQTWCLGGAFLRHATDQALVDVNTVEGPFEKFKLEVLREGPHTALAAGYSSGLAEGCHLNVGDTGGRDNDDGGDGAGSGAVDVYMSPHFGYTVTYSANVWERFSEGDDPYGLFDSVCFQNGISVICVEFSREHNKDEMNTCVANYVNGLVASDRVTNVEALNEPGAFRAEEELVWGTYTYVSTNERGDGINMTRFIACGWTGDVTIEILHDAPSSAYADQVPARTALVDGIDIGSGLMESREGEGADVPPGNGDGAAAEASSGENVGGGGASGANEAYLSWIHSYTVTYDADVWELLNTNLTPDENRARSSWYLEANCFGNGVSMVCVEIFTYRYVLKGEANQCVHDIKSSFERQDMVHGVKELDEPGAFGASVANGRSWGTYTWVLESSAGDQDDATAYIECIWINEAVTIAILHYVPSNVYQTEVAAREEFLKGIGVLNGLREGGEG